MKEWTVAEYASDAENNIWKRKVSSTAVYTAIEKGKLGTIKRGEITFVKESLVDGLIEDRVLILPDPKKTVDEMGSKIPLQSAPTPDTGTVVMVGPGIKDGQEIVLQAGMHVKFEVDRRVEFKFNGQNYFILRQPQVHLILPQDDAIPA